MSTIHGKCSIVSPAAQASTNAYAAITGSTLTMKEYLALAYTIKVATNAIKWKVQGANSSDFSDAVDVQAEATVAAAAVGYYAVSIAPYIYYRVVIIDDAAPNHGTVTLVGVAKG